MGPSFGSSFGSRPPAQETWRGTAELSSTQLIQKAIGLGPSGGGHTREEMNLVQHAFRQWDINGDGVITQPELHRTMQRLDSRFTAGEVRRLFSAADANGDGAIDHQEFVQWLFRDRY